MARFRLDDQARAAIAASSLGSLPQEVIAELTAGAKRLRIPARSTFRDAGEDSPHLELVVASRRVPRARDPRDGALSAWAVRRVGAAYEASESPQSTRSCQVHTNGSCSSGRTPLEADTTESR